jgi:dTDP-4-amino-4,6-dideoxygalactose transaminase
VRDIPLIDLRQQYRRLKLRLKACLERVFDSGQFILGQEVEDFEREFAAYCRARYAVGVASGTDALLLSLRACGVSKGDQVIVPSFTFIAVATAVTYLGAIPRFIDIDEQSFAIDPDKIEEGITPRTKAIIPVHLYGQAAQMDKIIKIARKNNLMVIEDACQAHGALFKGRKVGTFGGLGCFSFYPSKNLGGYGDGGMVVSSDARLIQRVRVLRNYGQTEKYLYSHVGYNSRLDAIQAALLRLKLPYLDRWNRMRRRIARWYSSALKGLPLVLPRELPDRTHVYHVYAIRSKQRQRLQAVLAQAGIQTAIHYPVPLHLQECFRGLGYKPGDFPVAERVSKEILSLPMYPELTHPQVNYIASIIRSCL